MHGADHDQVLRAGCRLKVNRRRCEHVVMGVSLGMHVEGAALPLPDTGSWENWGDAVSYRCCRPAPRKTPPRLLRHLRAYVRVFVRRHFRPLEGNTDLSLQTWLSKTSYSAVIKNQFLKAAELGVDPFSAKAQRFKGFLKSERMPSCSKIPRGINAPSITLKMHLGPVFHAIEEIVYSHKAFVKHIPERDRPKYIMDTIGWEGSLIATDYTCFDGHLGAQLRNVCEWELYKYMCSRLPLRNTILELIQTQMGFRRVSSKFGSFMSDCRMSGEMCTSLGNGFTNLVLMSYILNGKGVRNANGIVEGDDGLFVVREGLVTPKDFEALGMRIKIKRCSDVSSAEFCGLIFDTSVRENVVDPAYYLASTGWSIGAQRFAGPRVRKELLRAKGYSLLYMAPKAPVIRSLAKYILRCTRGLNCREDTSMWRHTFANGDFEHYKPELDARLLGPIPFENRILVERCFGVSVGHQLQIERYLDTQETIHTLDLPEIREIMPVEWCRYFNQYSAHLDWRGQRSL